MNLEPGVHITMHIIDTCVYIIIIPVEVPGKYKVSFTYQKRKGGQIYTIEQLNFEKYLVWRGRGGGAKI